MSRPRLGVFGLTGCAGDQLVLLNCEDELLELACLTDVRDFLMASSANELCGERDVALVEGAVAGRWGPIPAGSWPCWRIPSTSCRRACGKCATIWKPGGALWRRKFASGPRS